MTRNNFEYNQYKEMLFFGWKLWILKKIKMIKIDFCSAFDSGSFWCFYQAFGQISRLKLVSLLHFLRIRPRVLKTNSWSQWKKSWKLAGTKQNSIESLRNFLLHSFQFIDHLKLTFIFPSNFFWFWQFFDGKCDYFFFVVSTNDAFLFSHF